MNHMSTFVHHESDELIVRCIAINDDRCFSSESALGCTFVEDVEIFEIVSALTRKATEYGISEHLLIGVDRRLIHNRQEIGDGSGCRYDQLCNEKRLPGCMFELRGDELILSDASCLCDRSGEGAFTCSDIVLCYTRDKNDAHEQSTAERESRFCDSAFLHLDS